MEKAQKSKKRIRWTTRFIRDVQHFHATTGMKFPSIGRRAIQNPHFMDRLLEGGTITLESADRVYDFMAEKGYLYDEAGAIDSLGNDAECVNNPQA